MGWEASINVNAYYYQDGNRIYEASPNDASKDPDDHHPKNGWTFNNAVLGYAAATASGMKKSGTLTKDNIEELTTCYLRRLTEQAYRRGVPAHLLFTHQGGNYVPWDRHLSFRPAIQANSIPGWSFYSHDPPDCGSLAKDMDSAGRTQWAASEWWRGAPDTATWCERFRRTLTFKHCRFICIYNWEPFAKEPAAIAAVRELVQAATTSTPASE